MREGAHNLEDLPDELILEIVHYFKCIRSYETQSTAFKIKSEEEERQRENRTRQRGLHSLCLTSRRLRGIAVPTLYASFMGSVSFYGMNPLKLFHRTVSSSDCATGLDNRLVDYVQYIENRSSDFLGNNLGDDAECPGVEHMLARYYYLLADIVRSAPNLEHLSVVSIETDETSLWRHLVPMEAEADAPPSLTTIENHGLGKLHTLCLQVHTQFGASGTAADFFRICSELTSLPSLSDYRASGATSNEPSLPLVGTFKSLQRVEITECELDLDEVAALWTACNRLRHIVCAWAYRDYASELPSDLYPGLLPHAGTLETLHLDMREVHFSRPLDSARAFGSLRPFTALKSMAMCERTLWGVYLPLVDDPDPASHDRLSELIPFGLESFSLLFESDIEAYCRLENVIAMTDLLHDLELHPLLLKEIKIISDHALNASSMEAAFAKVGVSLTTLVDESRRY
jgi:hypothetical protein